MSQDGFDYGGEVAETVSKFKQPKVGVRNARLYGLLRLGTFSESFNNNGKVEIKAPAPQGIAIFHMLGKEDKMDDGEPMFFTKSFPFKKGEKSFLHSKFIPAFGGMAKHSGFPSMVNNLFSLKLKGGKDVNDDGTPKYVNFDAMSEVAEDMLELIESSPQYAALESPVGFLTEATLTKEALEMLHPTREFAGILMETQEFKAGTHPSQALIQAMYDENTERYTVKKKDAKAGEESPAGTQAASTPQSLPENVESLDEEREF